MIVKCDNSNIKEAGKVYKSSWYESHKDFCNIEFLKRHTLEYQIKILKEKINNGWEIFISYKEKEAVSTDTIKYMGRQSVNINCSKYKEDESVSADYIIRKEEQLVSTGYINDKKEQYTNDKGNQFGSRENIHSKEGQAVGVVGINYNTGEIGLLYVLPTEFRKGYGLELLDFAFKKISKYKNPFLIVLNINKRAIKLYERYGFYYSNEKKILSTEKEISELKYVIN